jgi:ubiquitin-like protein ATG12
MSSSPIPDRSIPGETAPIPDDDHEADLPLTMTASVVLTSLPHDARAGLATAGAFEREKGNVISSLHSSLRFLSALHLLL